LSAEPEADNNPRVEVYVNVTLDNLPVVSVGDDGTIGFSGGVRHDVEE